jgi:hypothetical protein
MDFDGGGSDWDMKDILLGVFVTTLTAFATTVGIRAGHHLYDCYFEPEEKKKKKKSKKTKTRKP